MSDAINQRLDETEKSFSEAERFRYLRWMEQACGDDYRMRAGFRRGWLAKYLSKEEPKETARK